MFPLTHWPRERTPALCSGVHPLQVASAKWAIPRTAAVGNYCHAIGRHRHRPVTKRKSSGDHGKYPQILWISRSLACMEFAVVASCGALRFNRARPKPTRGSEIQCRTLHPACTSSPGRRRRYRYVQQASETAPPWAGLSCSVAGPDAKHHPKAFPEASGAMLPRPGLPLSKAWS